MAYPTIRVEAAFTVGTTAAFILNDPTRGLLDTATLSNEVWTDITAYANAFTVRRGASRAEGPILRFEAGTLSLTLDNSDRRFDPSNTAGPYVTAGVSQVTPMRQVRIIADFAGVAYPVFTGYADSWDISYDEPAMSTCTLTATDATKVLSDHDRVALGSTFGHGELSGARVHRILDSVGWPIGQRDIDAGKSGLEGTLLDGTAWSELLEVQDSEIGQVFIDGNGYVAFRDRSANMLDPRSTTVQAAFGDGAGELPFVDHTIQYDDTSIKNVVRITRALGTQQIAEDATSRAQYLTHVHERSGLLIQTDAESTDYAAFVLYQAKDPELRFTELTVQGNDDDAVFVHMLAREFGDLITLTRRPPGGGPVTTRRCFIVGVSHNVSGPGEWRTTWSLQPAAKWTFMTLNNTQLGVLDANALAY